ncbi:MAG: C10 family peptidase [Candidatus Cloacimonadales bacterium]
MKKMLIITLFLSLLGLLFAAPISLNEAEQAASLKIQIEEKNDFQIISSETISNQDGLDIAHLFRLAPAGFILIATDSDIHPLIGYSFENDFVTAPSQRNIALQMVTHDQSKRHQVLDQISNEMRNENNSLWQKYLNNNLNALKTRDPIWPPANYVSPNDGWMHTEWDQSFPYFNFCPLDNAGNGRSVVGCVATAATQIIYYHKYFDQPNLNDTEDDYWSGYSNYVHIDNHAEQNDFPAFPELNDYLVSTEDRIKHSVAFENDDYAALCFAFGITVDMDYGSSASGGSGTQTSAIAPALLNRWGYESANHYQGWSTAIKNVMINDMENGRPGVMAIFQSGAAYGHAINYDGYNANDDTFHLNYGWSGNSNGWYNIPAGMPDFDTITGVVANINDGWETFTLTGNINAEGNSVAGVELQIRQNDFVLDVTPDAEGDFEVPFLLPGTYLVEAVLELPEGGYYYYSENMELSAPNGYISISMLPFTEFSGNVSAPISAENANIAIYQAGLLIDTAVTAADGSFETAGLLPGEYLVTASLADNYFGSETVEISFSNQNVEIALMDYGYNGTVNYAGPATDLYTFVPFTLSMGIQIAGENLAPYADDVFTKVRFKSPADPENAEIWAQIWEGNILVSETAVTEFAYGEWVTVNLDHYVEIDPEKIYYAGYKIISGDGVMAWHDAGPRVEGGAYSRNTGWISVPATNDFNFNIQAITISETLEGEENVIQLQTSLESNYPNPFNPTTTISYNLAEEGEVELEIFNVKGQKVKTLVSEKQAAGTHSVVWNGKDNSGSNLSSGVYFYKLRSGSYTSTRKMILLK